MQESSAGTPQADTTLAALAVMEQFSRNEFEALDALLKVTDEHELVMGLLDVTQILTSMLANATGVTSQGVLDHLRKMVLDLINAGELASGPVVLPQ